MDTAVVRSIVPPQYLLLPVNETLFSGFPTGKRRKSLPLQHPKLTLRLINSCNYNISSSLDLLFFSQFRFSFPLIDMAQKEFSWRPFYLADNLTANVVLGPTTGAGDDVILEFTARELLSNVSETKAAFHVLLICGCSDSPCPVKIN